MLTDHRGRNVVHNGNDHAFNCRNIVLDAFDHLAKGCMSCSWVAFLTDLFTLLLERVGLYNGDVDANIGEHRIKLSRVSVGRVEEVE